MGFLRKRPARVRLRQQKNCWSRGRQPAAESTTVSKGLGRKKKRAEQLIRSKRRHHTLGQPKKGISRMAQCHDRGDLGRGKAQLGGVARAVV